MDPFGGQNSSVCPHLKLFTEDCILSFDWLGLLDFVTLREVVSTHR
jgi:hypothetical protein